MSLDDEVAAVRNRDANNERLRALALEEKAAKQAEFKAFIAEVESRLRAAGVPQAALYEGAGPGVQRRPFISFGYRLGGDLAIGEGVLYSVYQELGPLQFRWWERRAARRSRQRLLDVRRISLNDQFRMPWKSDSVPARQVVVEELARSLPD